MRRVTAIGGIFFKSANPGRLLEWYRRHLGIDTEEGGGAAFLWRDYQNADREGMTVWSVFPADTDYFGPGPAPFMINYRVENLDEVLDDLRREGVPVDPRREDSEYGRFGWIEDPDGNRIELWEPPSVELSEPSRD